VHGPQGSFSDARTKFVFVIGGGDGHDQPNDDPSLAGVQESIRDWKMRENESD